MPPVPEATKELRRIARKASAAKREPTERRVYNLPGRMVDSILKRQIDERLPSEAAIVRLLLNEGLRLWEASKERASA